jgi:HEPN domain-containing protein
MADNSYAEETPEDLFINAVRDILAVKTLLNGTFYPSDAMYIPITFHVLQAVEKQLKGFIIENRRKVRKIHNLDKLLEQVSNIDNSFTAIEDECILLNKYLSGVKYSNDKAITKSDINNIIRALSIINDFPPLKSLRDSVSKKYQYEIIAELATRDEPKPSHAQDAMPNSNKKQEPEPDIGY